MALFRHKVTGKFVERPAHYAKHPVLGRNLELVKEEVKPTSEKKQSAKKTTDNAAKTEVAQEETPAIVGSFWKRPVGVEIPQEQVEALEKENENNEEK